MDDVMLTMSTSCGLETGRGLEKPSISKVFLCGLTTQPNSYLEKEMTLPALVIFQQVTPFIYSSAWEEIQTFISCESGRLCSASIWCWLSRSVWALSFSSVNRASAWERAPRFCRSILFVALCFSANDSISIWNLASNNIDVCLRVTYGVGGHVINDWAPCSRTPTGKKQALDFESRNWSQTLTIRPLVCFVQNRWMVPWLCQYSLSVHQCSCHFLWWVFPPLHSFSSGTTVMWSTWEI